MADDLTPEQKRFEIDKRRMAVANLYLQGHRQQAIAAQCEVSQATVANDIKAIRRHWRESEVTDYETLRAEIDQKNREIYRAAWDGWRRSIGEAKRFVEKKAKGQRGRDGETAHVEQSTIIEHKAGDPKFLEVAGRSLDRSMRIYGVGEDKITGTLEVKIPGEQEGGEVLEKGLEVLDKIRHGLGGSVN